MEDNGTSSTLHVADQTAQNTTGAGSENEPTTPTSAVSTNATPHETAASDKEHVTSSSEVPSPDGTSTGVVVAGSTPSPPDTPTDVGHHSEPLMGNYSVLLNEVKPRLFLDRLADVLSPDVCNSVRRQSTDLDQSDRLLSQLLQGPRSWYEAFLRAVAGLYPDIFNRLTERHSSVTERLWYVHPLQEGLRQSVLKRPKAKNHLLSVNVDMEHQFVVPCLRLHEQKDCNDNILPGEEKAEGPTFQALTESDLLPAEDTGGTMLIYGRAGVGQGKTCYQRQGQDKFIFSVWRWAHEHQWVDRYSLVFTLNLRRLVLFQYGVGLASLLQEYTEFPADSSLPEEGLAKWLENNSSKVLIILDGLDELNQFQHLLESVPRCTSVHARTTPLNWAINLLRKDVLENCFVVVTSRPFQELSNLKLDRQVEVAGFTEEAIREYIERNVDRAHRERITDTICKNPFLLSVNSISFYCAALCAIFTDSAAEWESTLSTYTRITWYIIRHLASAANPGKPATLLPDYFLGCLACLEELAFRGLPKCEGSLTKLIFDEVDLNAVGLSQDGLDRAVKSGLLVVQQRTEKLQLHVEFIHRSVQEFLAMRKLLGFSPEQLRAYVERYTWQIDVNILFLYGLGLDRELRESLQLAVSPRNVEVLEEHARRYRTEIKKYHYADIFFKKRLVLAKLVHETQCEQLAQELSGSVLEQGSIDPNGQMTSVDMRALRFLLKGSKELKTITIEYTSLDDACHEQLGYVIRDAPHLKNLRFLGSHITEKAFLNLMKSVGESSSVKRLFVTELFIRQNTNTQGKDCPMLTSKCVESLCQAASTCDSFDNLFISKQAISESGMHQLSLATCHLDELEFLHVKVSETGMRHLSEGIAQSQKLTKLTFTGGLSVGSIMHLSAGISKSPSLIYLQLSRVRIDHRDWTHLSHAFRCSRSLSHLDLQHQTLDDSAVRLLCDGIRESTLLRELTMGHCALSHSSVFELRTMRHWMCSLKVNGEDMKKDEV